MDQDGNVALEVTGDEEDGFQLQKWFILKNPMGLYGQFLYSVDTISYAFFGSVAIGVVS